MSDPHRLQPGNEIRIRDLPTRADDFHQDRDAAEREFDELRRELAQLQFLLYAEGRRKLLVLFQAMDAGGKDGTIRHVFRGVNSQGVDVTAFRAPSENELAHDFLWRIHAAVPASGMVGVFNRSHYEDVLVVRVDELVPRKVWRPRYKQINRFEKYLTSTGTAICKFFLHISKDEQKQRFEERLEDPEKHWKFSAEDLAKRKKWDAYMDAYEDVLNRCTTEWAPWHVIPSDQKWYRNLAVTRVLVSTLRGMQLQLPEVSPDVANLVIE